jgi:ABC-type multidrug transport system fused ATPase/permease subunit
MFKFLDNKRLWWFAGEDPYVLGQCSKSLRRTFSLIGILVVIISAVSALSLTYGVDQILESVAFDVVIGIYCALFVFVLYLFILHTLSRNVLPVAGESLRGRLLSKMIRVSFLVFLGFFVAQPLSYIILETPVDEELSIFKKEEIELYNNRLNLKYARLLQEKRVEDKSTIKFRTTIGEYNQQKNREIRKFMRIQNDRNFFIQKIILMNTRGIVQYLSWLLSLILISIFILPVILKSMISFSSEYYRVKKTIQSRIVDKHHTRFVQTYNDILKTKYGYANLSYHSAYIDPPYNTQLKRKPKLRDKTQFLKWLLNENN